MRLQARAVSQQLPGFFLRFAVVVGLVVRQYFRRVEHVDRPGHVGVDKTHQPVVTRNWKPHCIALTGYERARIHASARKTRPIKSRSGARASNHVGGSYLTRRQEADGVDLVCKELPGDGVADVDPELVRKKRQNLTSFVRALDAGERTPLGRLCACGKNQ